MRYRQAAALPGGGVEEPRRAPQRGRPQRERGGVPKRGAQRYPRKEDARK